MTTTITTSSRNAALTGARVVSGLLAVSQLAGIAFFVLIAPEEAVWMGALVDVPIVALMLSGALLKLGLALLPGLPPTRRIEMGFLAVAIGIAVTLVKIPVYDEPEGVLFLAFDAFLFALLVAAWRAARR
jgi:hypothetical protein